MNEKTPLPPLPPDPPKGRVVVEDDSLAVAKRMERHKNSSKFRQWLSRYI